METNSLQRRQSLEEKVPELERTIAMVETLQRKKVSSRGESSAGSIVYHSFGDVACCVLTFLARPHRLPANPLTPPSS